jgi:hypothetical protein
MAVSQMAMVAVMTMTPLHMKDHGHAELSTFVIAVHVLGMFGLAPLLGRWADRIRRIRALQAGALILGAGTVAAVVAGYVPALMFVGLFLLGVGWSVALIAGSAKVLVVTETDSSVVVAYYAWAMVGITVEDAPDRLCRGAGRYPQPVALLARLGVDVDHEERGLGAGLLQDVLSRVAELGANIGCRGLLVHAEGDLARDFYLYLVPGVEPSPTDPLHLVLLMKDIHRTVRVLSH